jgi:urea transporter
MQVFSGVVLSMSQVYGINHAPAAVLMYLAVVIYSPIMAAFAVLGATVATLTGMLSPTPFSFLFSTKVGTKFRRQVAVAQSVQFTCGLRSTEFVSVCIVCFHTA